MLRAEAAQDTQERRKKEREEKEKKGPSLETSRSGTACLSEHGQRQIKKQFRSIEAHFLGKVKKTRRKREWRQSESVFQMTFVATIRRIYDTRADVIRSIRFEACDKPKSSVLLPSFDS